MGGNRIPLIIVMTKIDKLSRNELTQSFNRIKNKLLESWDELPVIIQSSTVTKLGREEILSTIENAMSLT
jgi:GTP-binding protein